jgi:hypothetical protein
MASDDLRGCIALDALSTAVPTADPTLGGEQINRAILDALDQQCQLRGAAQQILLSLIVGFDLALELRAGFADLLLEHLLEPPQFDLCLALVVTVEARADVTKETAITAKARNADIVDPPVDPVMAP